MRSKDRLAELHHRMAESGGGGGGGGGVYRDTVEQAGARLELPPHIDNMLREVESMRGWIHEMNGNTQLVRRLHADPTFHNNKQLQEQLEAAASATGALGARVCGALRSLEGATRAGAGGNTAGARMARLQYAATRALLAAALDAHHAALAALRDHQRDLLLQQIQLTNLTISDEECESLLESKNLSLFVDNVAAETVEARRALREVEARHAELARVEGALRQVRDLFAHLALRVATQQEQVDRVEYYALAATEHVECGGQELLKGTVSRTKARKKKMSLIICVAVGVLIVLLVLVFT